MKRICGLPLLALVGLVLTLPAFSKGTEKKNENVIIDQPYVTYNVDRKTGDLTVDSGILLPKKITIFGDMLVKMTRTVWIHIWLIRLRALLP